MTNTQPYQKIKWLHNEVYKHVRTWTLNCGGSVPFRQHHLRNRCRGWQLVACATTAKNHSTDAGKLSEKQNIVLFEPEKRKLKMVVGRYVYTSYADN